MFLFVSAQWHLNQIIRAQYRTMKGEKEPDSKEDPQGLEHIFESFWFNHPYSSESSSSRGRTAILNR